MCMDHLQLPGASKEEESGALPWLPAYGNCREGLLGVFPGSAGKVGTTHFAFLLSLALPLQNYPHFFSSTE